MGCHQTPEARLLGGGGLQDDLAQVRARVLGWWLLRRLISALPGGVQSRGQLHGKTVNLG